jgi:hypothetical protein
LHEKTTWTVPFEIAAGRSPSCAVPPIMALMTDEQKFLKKHEFGLVLDSDVNEVLA